MRRITPTGLLLAIIVLLAAGVATAVVRESRDQDRLTAPPAVTAPNLGAVTPSTLPTTTTTDTTAIGVPTTRAPAAGAPTVPPTTAVAPSVLVSPPPTSPSAMPNTGGELPSTLGLVLLLAGLAGRRLAGHARRAGYGVRPPG